jgi:hypothetical protein
MARKRIPVTGTYKVRRSGGPGDAPVDHMHNYNQAIQNALDDLKWPLGDHEGASLHLSATVRVTNPGKIIEYCATFI